MLALPLLLVGLTACPTQSQIGLPAGSLPEGRYVALGDSFSSGEGVPVDFNSTPFPYSSHDKCDRSTESYSEQLASLGGPKIFPVDFVACSGALIADFSTQNHDKDNSQEPPQRQQLVGDGTDGTKVGLVTLSFGGNDVGFKDIIEDCAKRAKSQLPDVSPWGVGACHDAWEATVEKNLGTIDGSARPMGELDRTHDHPSTLRDLYREIRMLVGPTARILVVGYPHEFPDNPGHDCAHIDSSDQPWANTISDRLNDVIISNIKAANAGIEYVPKSGGDNNSYFAGHGLCGGSEHFNNPDDCLPAFFGQVCMPNPWKFINKVYLFHPNKDGQNDYARAIIDELTQPAPQGATPAPTGQSTGTTPPALPSTPPLSSTTASAPPTGCPGFTYFDAQPGDQCTNIGGTLNQSNQGGWTITVGALTPSLDDTGGPQLCSQITAIKRGSEKGYMFGIFWSIETDPPDIGRQTAPTIGGTMQKTDYIQPGGTAQGTECFPDVGYPGQVLVVFSAPGNNRAVWITNR
jgi:GDSL-like Lipase/Acylhydrolase family